jgi:DNA-binding MarR family transcriptional regulator
VTNDDADLNLGLLLFIPYRHMETAVLAALKAHGHDIPLNQARVFQRIAPDGSRLAELADAAQVSKQTVGSIIDQLEKSGYVERTPDPTDARARLVRITPRGQELITISQPVVQRIEAEWRAHLGDTGIRQLRRLLNSLRHITDPFNEDQTQPSG